MSFFTTLVPFIQKGPLTLVLMPIGTDAPPDGPLLAVSVLLDQPCGDAAAQGIPPFVVRGTAAALDSDFLIQVERALQAKVAVVDEMDQFMARLDQAKRESQAQKHRDQQEQKVKTEKEKTFDKLMKAVEELEATKQYHKAIARLPGVTEYADQADVIGQKRNYLLTLLNAGSLFALSDLETPETND